MTGSSSEPALPAASSRRGLRTVGTRRSSSSIAAATSAATPTTATTMRASSSTSTGRTSSTRIRGRSSTICRSSPHGASTSTTFWRRSTGMLVPVPINLDTVNKLYGLNLTSSELEEWFARRAEPVDRDQDVRGRRRVGRRPRTLRKVLSRLHPQAMGPRPVRARQVGHLARADADESRRPLLHRRTSVHAEARLHAHVRADGQTTRTSTS